MSVTEISLERETANDESALVVAIFAATGTAVEQDELLFEIENSKAVQEVRAPKAGILAHQLEVGQTVDFGVAIAQIVPEGWEPASPVEAALETIHATQDPEPETVRATEDTAATQVEEPKASGRTLAEPRFSHAAQALVAKHGLAPAVFDLDFVTSRDVLKHIGLAKPTLAPPAAIPAPTPKTVAPAKVPRASRTATGRSGQAIGPRKRAEIETLSQGAGNMMLSLLGIRLGPMPVQRSPGDFLEGRITDLVIYETSRLMRKFPHLNSYFADGQVFAHEAVNAGLAIDSGGRLVVYGIENSDRIGLLELSNTMADAVGRYMDNELTLAEMTRATFTVTDLSADELDFVLPLLPSGQSCILGITHATESGYRLFAGFDHRVTEGREVAAFLGELRERLLSFASSGPMEIAVSRCAYCDRSLAEAVSGSKEKGLLKIVGRDGREALCCGSCWNGW